MGVQSILESPSPDSSQMLGRIFILRLQRFLRMFLGLLHDTNESRMTFLTGESQEAFLSDALVDKFECAFLSSGKLERAFLSLALADKFKGAFLPDDIPAESERELLTFAEGMKGTLSLGLEQGQSNFGFLLAFNSSALSRLVHFLLLGPSVSKGVSMLEHSGTWFAREQSASNFGLLLARDAYSLLALASFLLPGRWVVEGLWMW